MRCFGLPQPCGSKACGEVRAVLANLEERFIRTAEQLTEAETIIAELENSPSVQASTADQQRVSSRTRPTGACSTILTALHTAICGHRYSDETASRLMTRLERWVAAQLARSSTLEEELRQQVTDLQVALADKISPQVRYQSD